MPFQTIDENPLVAAPDGFGAIFVITLVVIGLVIVVAIITIVRNAGRARDAGLDPMTLRTDLAVAALGSAAMQPPVRLEDRLAELRDLHERGVISDEEHRAARAAALAGSD